jgi:hypothetical protein
MELQITMLFNSREEADTELVDLTADWGPVTVVQQGAKLTVLADVVQGRALLERVPGEGLPGGHQLHLWAVVGAHEIAMSAGALPEVSAGSEDV